MISPDYWQREQDDWWEWFLHSILLLRAVSQLNQLLVKISADSPCTAESGSAGCEVSATYKKSHSHMTFQTNSGNFGQRTGRWVGYTVTKYLCLAWLNLKWSKSQLSSGTVIELKRSRKEIQSRRGVFGGDALKLTFRKYPAIHTTLQYNHNILHNTKGRNEILNRCIHTCIHTYIHT